MSKEIKKKYAAKIIRAPALLKDTRIFLSSWDEGLSVDDNMQRAVEKNLFGRPARSYVKQFLTAFRERYVLGDERDEALRILACKGRDESAINRILYYHTALADSLLYDFVVDYLFERYSHGYSYVTTKEAEDYIKKLSQEGKTTTLWSENVCNRVARNTLTSLRDFLILEGNVKKRIAPIHLPVSTFLYVAFFLSRRVDAGEKVLHHRDWQLFLLDASGVERLFLEAHQQKLLNYHSIGKIIRIEYPYRTIREVVNAIIS